MHTWHPWHTLWKARRRGRRKKVGQSSERVGCKDEQREQLSARVPRGAVRGYDAHARLARAQLRSDKARSGARSRSSSLAPLSLSFTRTVTVERGQRPRAALSVATRTAAFNIAPFLTTSCAAP